jgi:hypothetical protein
MFGWLAARKSPMAPPDDGEAGKDRKTTLM